MKIGPLDTQSQIVLVAEIGNNHEGDPAVARELVEHAADAGAGAVKVQVFRPDLYVSASEPARIEQLRRFELPDEVHAELREIARRRGLAFVATPLDLDSAHFLEPLVDAFKIASGDNDNPRFIGSVASARKPVIVSAGMCDRTVIARAKAAVEAEGAPVAVLHCISAYPAPPAAARLSTIPWLARELGCPVGYSDHTLGIETCVLAAAAGARIVEKHFTLRHDFSEFRDHRLSADPRELCELAQRLGDLDEILGSPREGVLSEEAEIVSGARRALAAARDLPAGHTLAEADLTWLRPRADGIPPAEEATLIGRRLLRAVGAGEPLARGDVES